MLVRTLLSHRVLFAIAGAHWGGGIAMVPFERPWAFVILIAGATITILAGQRAIAAHQQHAEALQEGLGTAAGVIADFAEITLRGRPSDSGAHLLYPLHAVEDGRSEPA